MPYSVISIGGATEDIVFYTAEGLNIENKKDLLRSQLLAFEAGAKIKIDRTFPGFGGGAANAAVNFAGLGLKTAVLVCLGKDDRAAKMQANFKHHRVDSSLLKFSPTLESGFSFILIDHHTKERIIFSARGANAALKIDSNDLKTFETSKWLYLTALSGGWRSSLKTIYKVKKPLIAWNPGGMQIKEGAFALAAFLKKTEFLFVNRDEAIELVLGLPKIKKMAKKRKFVSDIKNLLATLKELGPHRIIITDGRHGAYYFDGQLFNYQPAIIETKRLDVSGVGDAFNSSVIAGLEIYKGDIKKAMLLAAKNTAAKVGHLGAQNGLLKLKDLKNIKGLK